MSAAVEPLLVEIEGGVILCLPPVLNTITTYVALEQEDWFEEEIAFVRRFLRRGMNAIDIGANYGVYGLTMAKAVGPGGRVVCIEPASETLAYLRAAIEQNGRTNIDLRAAALSAAPGRQRLRLEQSAELHRLDASSSDGELVEVETLDGVAEGFADGTLDFLKLDAEGEELNILKGGARTLARHSPLILFERKHVEVVNTPVIEALAAAGFAMYRVAPGLNMLVPYDPTSENRFQLNLIACRPDRAERLAADGLLAAVPPPAAEPDPQAWARDFGGKPYLAPFAARAGTADRAYGHALNLYATAMSPATRRRAFAGSARRAGSYARCDRPRRFGDAADVAGANRRRRGRARPCGAGAAPPAGRARHVCAGHGDGTVPRGQRAVRDAAAGSGFPAMVCRRGAGAIRPAARLLIAIRQRPPAARLRRLARQPLFLGADGAAAPADPHAHGPAADARTDRAAGQAQCDAPQRRLLGAAGSGRRINGWIDAG